MCVCRCDSLSLSVYVWGRQIKCTCVHYNTQGTNPKLLPTFHFQFPTPRPLPQYPISGQPKTDISQRQFRYFLIVPTFGFYSLSMPYIHTYKYKYMCMCIVCLWFFLLLLLLLCLHSAFAILFALLLLCAELFAYAYLLPFKRCDATLLLLPVLLTSSLPLALRFT